MRQETLIRRAARIVIALCIVSAAHAEEPVDHETIGKIMDEGFNRSQVMETVLHLTDVIGPRLTNSPGMREAASWTKGQFEAYGLRNTRLEYFPFGRGWSYDTITVHMTSPRRKQLSAMPIAWHPGTDGPLEAEITVVSVESEDDLEKLEGEVEGKIVLLGKAREQDEPSTPVFVRLDDEKLSDLAEYSVPDAPSKQPTEWAKRSQLQRKALGVLAEQGALAIVRAHYRDGGLVGGAGYLYKAGETPALPGIELISEDYDRLVRLASRDVPVTVSIDVQAEYHDENHDGQNVLAEIPGRGSRPEIVMAGAHLDSWFMADGAIDNAAGSAVVMEAARILSAIGAKPKRTIRFALWDGEEQALAGSIFHVRKHFASRPGEIDGEPVLPENEWSTLRHAWPIEKRSDYERLSAYFNLDNGSGRIRGIYGEGNTALQPIFERWFQPFHELGAETVILRSAGGTDHQPFQFMGLPGFQFIQDPLDYVSRLHHTHIDTASHVYEKDLKQAAIIMASFLWHAANRDERLPRLPTPTRPRYPADTEEKDD
jgi:hypothetical protein